MSLTINTGGGEWAHPQKAVTGLSHRSTTSSRLPGRAIEGTVHRRILTIGECPKCHGSRTFITPDAPHALRWLNVSGRYVKVDCTGEVSP